MASVTAALMVMGSGCGATDPCANASSTCVALTVTSGSVREVDTLRITLSGAVSGTRDSSGGRVTRLPLQLPLLLPGQPGGNLQVQVEGLLAGTIAGNGSGNLTLAGTARERATLTVNLGSGTIRCDAPLMACGGQCVNIATSGEHCGACNHSCGGGECNQGVCQPTPVLSGSTNLHQITVDATDIYFTAGSRVLTCPASGCVVAPRQIADTVQDALQIVVANGTVFFESAPVQSTYRPTLYHCPLAGCPSPIESLFGPTLSGFESLQAIGDSVYLFALDSGYWKITCAPNGGACASPQQLIGRSIQHTSTDGTNIFFIDPNNSSALTVCPGTGCTTGTSLAANQTSVTQTLVFQNIVYTLSPGPSGGVPVGVIATCSAGGCNGTPANFIRSQPYPIEMTVDSSGVYWIASDDGTLRTCPLTGCVGGARILASGQSGARSLALGPGFVYWIDGSNTSILRVAK
ncbi:MAG TPA: hypothetical protein VH877_02765 [Polyangia bacterium]|nr:hypothetical protein [Polyangia bacterium]